MSPTMKRYLAVTTKEKPSALSSSTISSRKPEISAATSSKTMLSSSRSTRDLKKSTTVASGSSRSEVKVTQPRTVEPTAEPQVRKERAPPSRPVRPPFSSREAMPPPAEDKRAAPAFTRPPAQEAQVLSRPASVHLSRPATAPAFKLAGIAPEPMTSTTNRTGVQRPEPTFKRPTSPSSGRSDAALKSSASRPNSALAVEDLRKSTEERSTKGPRRVPKPPTPEEVPVKTSQSSRSAKLGTSGGKTSDRQVLSRSADANARKDALRAKLEAQTALGVTERRPNKGHARAASQPANMISKEKKPEVKKPESKTMPPPPPLPPRSASASSRPGLSAPTLAQLARMKETAAEAKPRPVKTFTKTVKGARAVIKPLTIRKGKRKSSLKAVVETAVVEPAKAATTDEVRDSEETQLEQHTEPSPACSEPEGPPHHPDAHDDNVPSPTEDEPTIREIAVLQSLVITPPPDSPGSNSTNSSSEGTTPSSSPSYEVQLHTPPRALFPTFPLQPAATPISALLFSIERGFVAPTPSHSVVADNTLPYPDNNDAADESDDEESVLKNIDFAMDGVDSCGKILQSPWKKGVNSANRSPLGYVDTNCT